MWLLWLSCLGGAPPKAPDAPDHARAGALADGSPCLSANDCASGACEGEGCGEESPGVCVSEVRPCTRDLRPYCGCDGETFSASSSCPNRRFAAPGPCP